MTREEAQHTLRLSRAQVDNLRRAGVLVSQRNEATGDVRITRTSVEAELRRRTGHASGASR